MKPSLLTASALLALAAAACGSKATPTTAVTWVLAESVDAQGDAAKAEEQTRALCDRHATIDLLFAHDDAMAAAANRALAAKGRKNVVVLGIGGAQAGRALVRDGVLAATIERPTCAEAALDLCLLALRGIALPPQARDYALGTRAITRDGDGDYQATAAEFLLQVTRRQHAAALGADTAAPKQKIAVVLRRDASELERRTQADLVAGGANRPQLELTMVGAAAGDTDRIQALTDVLGRGFRVAVILGGGNADLAAACKTAMAQGVTILALHADLPADACTYSVGNSNPDIGKLAGQTVRKLLPRGGIALELQAHADSRAARDVHQRFAQALSPTEPK